MQRLIAIALVAIGGVARAQPSPAPAPDPAVPGPPTGTAPDAGPTAPSTASSGPATQGQGPATQAPEEAGPSGDQAISAELGIATGGRVTPGGLRVAGQYLYQLSETDWFDGGVGFTFGSGKAACFRDRSDKVLCSHGLADGDGLELTASVRRVFAPKGAFQPFARVGIGIGAVRFDADDVTGVTVPAHAGGGVRVAVAPSISIVAEGDLELGFGSFNRRIGSELQFGLTIAAGAEFRLR